MFLSNLPDMSRYHPLFEGLEFLRYFPQKLVGDIDGSGESETEAFRLEADADGIRLTFMFDDMNISIEFPTATSLNRIYLSVTHKELGELAGQHYFLDHPLTVSNMNTAIVNAFFLSLRESNLSESSQSEAASRFLDECFVHEEYAPFRPQISFMPGRSYIQKVARNEQS